MSRYDEIVQHYTNFWSAPTECRRWKHGPINEISKDFCVARIAKSENEIAYATVCMSSEHDKEQIELHVFASALNESENSIYELLTMVAHYHRTGAKLGLGHTVNIGRPWLPGSECNHALISLPYMDGQRLERPEGLNIRFLWLIPITKSEVEYKKKNGLEALENLFEENELEYWDPLRKSVV